MCEYCQNKFDNKNFSDLMTDDSDKEGDEVMDNWGVPYIESNALTTFYAGTLGDITKRFKINFCPVCGRKLEEAKNEIYWYIESDGEVMDDRRSWHMTESDYEWEQGKEVMKRVGNFFETKEEAEKAVERLRAWKRLRDKGFRFDGWTLDDGLRISIRTNMHSEGIFEDDKNEIRSDLDICFGGEE